MDTETTTTEIKKMVVHKTTFAELAAHNIPKSDLVAVNDLNRYGLTEHIIMDMVKYDVWPKTYYVVGRAWVRKQAILHWINTCMHNCLALYKDVETCEKRQQDAIDLVKSTTVKLDDADLKQVEQGKSLTQIILDKAQQANNDEEEVTTDE